MQIISLPALVAQLQKEQTSLQREVKTTREKVKTLRLDQHIADRRLAKLSEATEARSAAMEMKLETRVSSFEMRPVDPGAAAALRDFAAETLKSTRPDDKIWVFDSAQAAGTARDG